ncbi:hypothetical protein FOZ60_007346 [Perkinsus olseni]|uniref:Pre-mRNA-splicing factor SLU7 n=1 Tax=Perkinsus olseni TaxID=32597 RepID=A0A7J6NLM5_PEROL|nr:hypothetical protein FOZ60_007346 [Perkinsus olseni]
MSSSSSHGDGGDEQQHIRNAAVGSFGGRVGHKAGGFIAKKFFHPSNLKNQEKLWLKMEEKRKHERQQEELMKRREEERRVELLREEMYRATGEGGSGAAKASRIAQELKSGRGGLITGDTKQQQQDYSSSSAAAHHHHHHNAESPEEAAASETKKRLLALAKQDKKDETIDDEDLDNDGRESRLVLNSRYEEDNYTQGHTSVWGSYFDKDTHRWGYACCKTFDRDGWCPNAPPSGSKKREKEPQSGSKSGKKKKRMGHK